ncbi:hypothetical protein, partial [Bacillus thuringiensis]|uniref:hypothetical protein n=1 Tax=Bacillus thuringiensis TaxID=1428 RepID=UPI00164311C6
GVGGCVVVFGVFGLGGRSCVGFDGKEIEWLVVVFLGRLFEIEDIWVLHIKSHQFLDEFVMGIFECCGGVV